MGFLKLTSVAVGGFGGLADGTYQIGNVTRLAGPNGVGKTSLGRAILYALTGLGLDGKPLAGAALADGADKCFVALTLENGEGPTVLMRTRTEKTGSVKLGRAPMTDAKLEAFLGMPARTFAALLWPELWFGLDQAAQTAVIQSVAPEADLQKLWDDLVGLKAEIDWTMAPKALHASWSKQRIDIEKEGAGISGQIRELEIQIDAAKGGSPEPLSEEEQAALRDSNARLTELNNEIERLLIVAREWDRHEHALAEWKRKADAEPVTTCSACGQKLPEPKRLDPGPRPASPSDPKPDETVAKLRDEKLAVWETTRDLEARAKAVEAASAAGTNAEERLEKLEATRAALMDEYKSVKAIETALHPKAGAFWPAVLESRFRTVDVPGYRLEIEDGQVRFYAESGRPVGSLSSGQRIKFCVALSGALAELGKPPLRLIFVEHMDLVDRLPRLPGFQLIGEKVSTEDGLVVDIKA